MVITTGDTAAETITFQADSATLTARFRYICEVVNLKRTVLTPGPQLRTTALHPSNQPKR